MTYVWREIVSQVLTTAAGSEVWLEMDAVQHLTVRCSGCGLDEYAAGMAPGLFRVGAHAAECDC